MSEVPRETRDADKACTGGNVRVEGIDDVGRAEEIEVEDLLGRGHDGGAAPGVDNGIDASQAGCRRG